MTKVVVLVDGDNISASHAALIRTKAARLGEITTCRVYTDAQGNSGWHEAHGFRVMHAGTGKNAADLLLSIDAMELALRDGKRQFVIVTSDGDFSHLAQRLLDHDCHVLGLGESKAPQGFRAACSGFEVIGLGQGGASVQPRASVVAFTSFPPVKVPAPASAPRQPTKTDWKVRELILELQPNGQGLQIGMLGGRMRERHRICTGSLPAKNWRTYLAQRPELYNLDAPGPKAKVRQIAAGFELAKKVASN